MSLIQDVREFWYNNTPGPFFVGSYAISRQDVHTYGGPDPFYDNCVICQRTEWLSRIKQQDLHEEHKCPTALDSCGLCLVQGEELLTHYHQTFSYSCTCDPLLPAPKILCFFPVVDPRYESAASLWKRYFAHTCDQWMINLRRGFAQAGQVTVVSDLKNVDWSRFDVLFLPIMGYGVPSSRPPIPIILYGHDLWGHNYQADIDALQPNVFLTPYPEPWQSNYSFSSETKMVFYPQPASQFFTRPNTDFTRKPIDLLVIGSTANPTLYSPRLALDNRLQSLTKKYNVVFSHQRGHLRGRHTGLTEFVDNEGETVRYLNKWSEYLGSAKYVTFGRFGIQNMQPLFMKYYECLGSGAVPVFPEVPDLTRLTVKPLCHYLPLDETDPCAQFEYLLANYDQFSGIGRTASGWHRDNADSLLFAAIEDAVQYVTDSKYPRRLIQ